MTVGERIKILRTERGISQEELGSMIGVQKAAIHKYETGLVVNLKQSTIAALAKALETSPSYLMGLDDEKPEANAMEKAMRHLGAIRSDGTVDWNRVEALAAFLEASKKIDG